jgi:Family of unknown function (DUF5763)
MALCRATKRDGTPCTVAANGPDGYCWAHSPANAEQRRSAARRAGSARPGKELTRMKEAVRVVIAKVERGELERNRAAVMLQGYRVLKDLLELERKVREQEDVLTRLDALEGRIQGSQRQWR